MRPLTLTLLPAALLLGACARPIAHPDRATRPYPEHLHLVPQVVADGDVAEVPRVVDLQVFRDGTKLVLVNSTPRGYEDFDLWVNQQYVRHVEALPAGETITLELGGFYNVLGEPFNAGGFWRAVEPQPVRMVEIETRDGDPLIGLITIRAERVEATGARR